MQGMEGIGRIRTAALKSCVLGEEQFQTLLTAQKRIKSFPFLEIRLRSQSSKTVRQDHNTPLEARHLKSCSERATHTVFSKVARGEGPHPSLCNNLKDCIPFRSRTAAEGGVEGASWCASPRAGSLDIPPDQPRGRATQPFYSLTRSF